MKTIEMCPYCEHEVELDAELSVQVCPDCGHHIVACSVCFCDRLDGYCSHCCLDHHARILNGEIEE